MALELGDEWNQKKVSLLEGKEVVDDALLDDVAKALKVTTEAIKNFNEESVVTNISCNFNDHSANVNYNFK